MTFADIKTQEELQRFDNYIKGQVSSWYYQNHWKFLIDVKRKQLERQSLVK